MKISQVNQMNVQGIRPSTSSATDTNVTPYDKVAKSVETRKIESTSNENFGGNVRDENPYDKNVDDEILKKSVEQANKSLSNFNRVIERSVHETTHTIMYTVKDSKTGEVIQEFPPKKIQDMIAKMWELAGLFVDEKA